MVAALRNGLAELLSLPDGYEIALGNGGTTAFWDAATFGLIDRRSQHLSFGEFLVQVRHLRGGRPHLDAPEVIESTSGTVPEAKATPDVDAYCLTHNETSTGVAAPLHRPEGAEGLVLVDATSGAGGLRFDPTQVDAYYFAPQKCARLRRWPVARRALPRRGRADRAHRRLDRWCPAFLDLGIALENSRKDQTYNTPALATIHLAVQQVEWIVHNGGLPFAAGPLRPLGRDHLRLGRGQRLRHAVRHRPDHPQPRGGHHRPRRPDRRAHGQRRAAPELHPRHRELPQAGAQPAAHRPVPRHRPRRRRGAHPLHRLRGRPSGPARPAVPGGRPSSPRSAR